MKHRRYLAALFLAALTLRPQLVGIGPLLPAIEDDLGVSHAVAGLLGTIPILCMGVFALPARHLSSRTGSRLAVAIATAMVGVFGVLRPLPGGIVGIAVLTIPIGVGMGLAGAVLPVVVKQRFADRPGFATGLYVTGMTIGAAVAAAVVVPLAHLEGGWRACLATFGAVSICLSVGWLLLTRSDSVRARAKEPPLQLPLRSPLGWHLVAAFALMSSVFYGLNAWLPDVYVSRGWTDGSAGALLGVMNAITIPCGFTVAWVADHWGTRKRWLTAAAALQLVGIAGLIAIPAAGWFWAVVLGIAIGPLFPLTMTLPLDSAVSPAKVGALTAMMLGVGYTISSSAPLLLGLLRDESGGFAAVLSALAVIAAILVVVDAFLPIPSPRAKAERLLVGRVT